MKFFLILLLSGTLLIGLTRFEKTYTIYKSGDFESSFKVFKTLAEDENDLDAAYILAYMYENGEGCVVDNKKAAHWYKIASRGYYYKDKDNRRRDIEKEQTKLYKSLKKSWDHETDTTIRQYSQALYNITAYDTNYFLPISYRGNGNYSATNGHEALNIETEFQLSIKYDFKTNIFGFDEIYSFGYTQLSYWQLYADSAYFRETNYNPEFFITLPVSKIYDSRFIRAFRFSFAHQSNGRGGEEERSWNYLAVSTFLQYEWLFTELKLWLPVASLKYNEDLMDYIGYGHLKFIIPYKQHLTKLLIRSSFHGKHAIELNYSHPIFGRDDLFLYIKGFNGYGESLIDYNNNVNKIGIGFSLSR